MLDDPRNAHAPTMRGAAADFGELRQSNDIKDPDVVQRWLLLRNAAVDARLSRAAIAVLAIILGHRNSGTGESFPGFDRMVAITGLHRTSHMRAVGELERFGYVEVKREANKPNRYAVSAWPDSNAWPTSRTDATGSADAAGRIEATDRSHSRTAPVAPTHKTSRTDATRTHLLTHQEQLTSNSRRKPRAAHAPGDGFSEFWNTYPRGEGKAQAGKIWIKNKLDGVADQILDDIRARMAHPNHWRDAQFIPHASTYLNQRRWEDDWQKTASRTNGAKQKFGADDDLRNKDYGTTDLDNLPPELRPDVDHEVRHDL